MERSTYDKTYDSVILINKLLSQDTLSEEDKYMIRANCLHIQHMLIDRRDELEEEINDTTVLEAAVLAGMRVY
jgi:hypothetical protein